MIYIDKFLLIIYNNYFQFDYNFVSYDLDKLLL